MSRARRIRNTSTGVARPGRIRRTDAAGRGSTGTASAREGLPVALGGVEGDGEAPVRAGEDGVLHDAHGPAAVLGESALHGGREPGDLGAAAGQDDVVA